MPKSRLAEEMKLNFVFHTKRFVASQLCVRSRQDGGVPGVSGGGGDDGFCFFHVVPVHSEFNYPSYWIICVHILRQLVVNRRIFLAELYDLRRTAIIGRQNQCFCAGEPLLKIEKVFRMRSSETIESLAEVANHKHVFVSYGEELQEAELQIIRILALVGVDP